MEPSGSIHPITKLAFINEIEKISAVTPQQQENRERAKRFLKSTAQVAAGSATAVGTFMVGDLVAGKLFGPWWSKQSPHIRHAIHPAAGGAAGVASAPYVKRLAEEREKYIKG